MKLKLISIGNSTGAIFPKEVLDKLRAQKGDEIHLLEGPNGRLQMTAFDAELEQQLAVADQVMRRRRNLLRKLAE